MHYGEFVSLLLPSSFVLRCTIGKFVSESKFINDPAAFIPYIQSRDREALEALITKPEVEMKLLGRLQKKVETYSPDIAADGDSAPKTNGINGFRKLNGGKIDIDGVLDLYESYIIPLTKEVEVIVFMSPSQVRA